MVQALVCLLLLSRQAKPARTKGHHLKRERAEALATAAAAFVRFELRDTEDDFRGDLTVTLHLFRGGIASVSSARTRVYDKEIIAAAQRS